MDAKRTKPYRLLVDAPPWAEGGPDTPTWYATLEQVWGAYDALDEEWQRWAHVGCQKLRRFPGGRTKWLYPEIDRSGDIADANHVGGEAIEGVAAMREP